MLAGVRFSRLGQRIASLALVAFTALTGFSEQLARALRLNPWNTAVLVVVAVLATTISTVLVITGDPLRPSVTDTPEEEPPS